MLYFYGKKRLVIVSLVRENLVSNSNFRVCVLQEARPIPKVPKDLLLAELLKKHEELIWKYHDHDSLLENQTDENLTEEERKAAWEEFENEKKGITNFANTNMLNQNLAMADINPAAIQVNANDNDGLSTLGQFMAILKRLVTS